MALRCVNSHKRSLVLSASVAVVGVTLAGLYAYSGVYGLNELLRLNWSFWTRVAPDDPGLPPSVRLGLRDPPPVAHAGEIIWRAVATGFEAGELPVVADGVEVDRILLARINPARFRFVVRNAPAGNKELSDWMTDLAAVFVINGSYYSPRGTPDTPLLSAGVLSGPADYEARHGAFVASRAGEVPNTREYSRLNCDGLS